jgi:1-phosphofructokinase
MTAPRAKIATLTLNPAIDETITLAKLLPGTVMRAEAVRFDAGGKGVNVAACLAAGSFSVTATGLLGRKNGAFFRKFLAGRGIEDWFLYIEGSTRTNIKLVTADNTTDINLPGLKATQAALDTIRQRIADIQSDFLVLAGSLPPGCPDDFYAGIAACMETGGARLIADCSGGPFKALMAAKARPFCIKPNRDELAGWAGRPLETRDCVLAEARKLHEDGIALVVVSMGHEGALFVSDEGAIHAGIKLDHVESTVGAGDAMVAGLAAALSRGASLENIARNATAWAAGKLECRGPDLPPPARVAELAGRTRCTFLD